MDGRGRRKAVTIVLIAVGALVLVGLALYVTGEPWFCASCHEMEATVDGWRQAPHADVSCFACHSEPGPIGYLKAHIVDGLRDVYVHTVERPDMTRGSVVPRQRCLQCHGDEFDTAEFTDVHPVGEDSYCPRCHTTSSHENLENES